MPNQDDASKLATPASAAVGTSGSSARRCLRRDRQRPQLAGLDVRHHGRRIVDHAVDLAGDQIGDGGCGAAIGHVRDLHVGGVHEHRKPEMAGGADAGRAEVDLAGLRLGERDELLERLAPRTFGCTTSSIDMSATLDTGMNAVSASNGILA